MKPSIIIIFILTSTAYLTSQSNWAGTYEGVLDRDQVKLTLIKSGKNTLSGNMTDSANKYDVEGIYSGNTFTGSANEKNLGLIFEMVSVLNGNQLQTTLMLDVFGKKEKMEITFIRSGSAITPAKSTKTDEKNVVSGKKRDPQVVGLWVKESNYNSGYGFNDTYGAMSVSEKMEFLADGTMADGGSQTVISGSNYYGTSSSGSKNILQGMNWYTDENKIYLVVTENGQSQTVELGKYFIENSHMLITGSNGEKLLLSKKK
ncbi:MAG: hypothetical protein IPL55_18015 [Saprospiraceae bacterium]|jgi:hypothetical protein|nr:hypothetical protein [Saprospiraceae bacterium]MBL0023945.1 hypothetical protein [Saprospiraceae bacterium]